MDNDSIRSEIEKAPENSFNFLADDEACKNLLFGHKEIAGTLSRIIRNCPTPFTIGLFGKWGTGKTNIINLLRSKLSETDYINIIVFDVWKYEHDSLRRQFLIECDEHLGLKKDWRKKLNQDLTVPGKIQISAQLRLVSVNIAIGLMLLGFLAAFIYLIFLIGSILKWNWTQNIWAAAGGPLVATVLAGVIVGSIKPLYESSKTGKTDSAEQFEHLFLNEVLQSSTISEGRLLVVFDNLDRVTHDKAVEALSTIKTFLEVKPLAKTMCADAVFLVACDEAAIKAHISTAFLDNKDNSDDFPPGEFLRKFFNTSIKIPVFAQTDLDDYTRDLLRETKTPSLDEEWTAWIITKAFRNNPRQIKQFVNTLLAHFLLAKECENGEIPLIQQHGAITGNPASLAKFLIMWELYPNLMREANDKYFELSDIENLSHTDSSATPKEITTCKKFLENTQPVIIDNLGLFFGFKQSREERDVPEAAKLIVALRDGNSDDVQNTLAELNENENGLKSFEAIVLAELNRNIDKQTNLVGIIGSSLKSLRNLKLSLSTQFYPEVARVIEQKLPAHLVYFEPTMVFTEILDKTNCYRTKTLDEYLAAIKLQTNPDGITNPISDFQKEVLGNIIAHASWLSTAGESAVKKSLMDGYILEPEIADYLTANPQYQKTFLADEIMLRRLTAVGSDPASGLKLVQAFEWMNQFEAAILTPKVTNSFLGLSNDLLGQEVSQPFEDRMSDKQALVDCIDSAVTAYCIDIEDSTVDGLLSTILTSLAQADIWPKKLIFIPLLFRLFLKKRRDDAGAQLIDFLENCAVGDFEIAFSKNPDMKNALLNEYPEQVIIRSVREKEFLDIAYPVATAELKTKLLVSLIERNYNLAFDKIRELHFKVRPLIPVVTALLDKVLEVDVSEKPGFYEVVQQLGCPQAQGLRKKLEEQIIGLLTSIDHPEQACGAETFSKMTKLPASNKARIVKSVIFWLETLDPNNAYQPFALQIILGAHTKLSTALQRRFTDFIFTKLILQSISADWVYSGVEMLKQLGIGYKAHKAQFDAMYSRANEETDASFREALINGLQTLAPTKATKVNGNFLTAVSRLKLGNEKDVEADS